MINSMPVVTAPAEVDAISAAQLRMILLRAAARKAAAIVVDMTCTRFCDSAGLTVLVRAHRRAVAEGGELRLVLPADGAVSRTFALTRLDLSIPVFGSLEEALAPRPAAVIGPLRPRPPSRPRGARQPGRGCEGAAEDMLQECAPAGRYGGAMKPVLRRMDAATYVKDIEASRAFYELLGFYEVRFGRGPVSAWAALRNGRDTVLLTSTRPPLPIPQLPLLFYFFFEDLDTLLSTLDDAGLKPVRLGHPPRAPGGEAKVTDPDGNTILLAQEERSPGQPPVPEENAQDWFSILKEAAALVQARGGTTARCEISHAGKACSLQAEVKLADSAGHSAWACLAHADEILVTVPEAFIASQDEGLAPFLSRG
jgi:anti-anti-sigma factor